MPSLIGNVTLFIIYILLKVYYISQIKVQFGVLNFKLERGVKIFKMVLILGLALLGPVRPAHPSLTKLNRSARLAY